MLFLIMHPRRRCDISKAARKNLFTTLIVLPLIAIAMSIRLLTLYDMLPLSALLLRSVIYIALLIAWGISLGARIIQTQVRRYLLMIVALMMLWLIFRTVKYIVIGDEARRLLWYLYYIPMLFIPLNALYVSMSLGQTEDYRLPLWTKLLYLPTAVLLMFVLTNDLHQCVFSFPSGIMSDRDYGYESIYYGILCWTSLCALASLVNMIEKCRITHSKTILFAPLIPLILSFAYTAAYVRGVQWVLIPAGDMTITHCLLIFCVFETCIRCGLIQSNIGYDELLEAASLPVQITDEGLNTLYVSAGMLEPLPADRLRKITANVVHIDDNTLLKRHLLDNGWVFWKENISELKKLRQELELTRQELSETGNVLEAENAQRENKLKLSEENRLYDMIESQTAEQIAWLKERLNELQSEENPARAERMLGQIIIVGTYIKRRSNLVLVGVQRGCVPVQELRLCLNESAENLILYGIDCKAKVRGDGELGCDEASMVYDLFEAVVEAGLETLKSMLVSVEVLQMTMAEPHADELGSDTDESHVQRGDLSVGSRAAKAAADGKSNDRQPPLAKLCVNLCVEGLTSASLEGLEERFAGIECEQDEDGLTYVSLEV